jgi:hypothetical protein
MRIGKHRYDLRLLVALGVVLVAYIVVLIKVA